VERAYTYVDTALKWGQQYGIGVLIELHAANGSQNGQDNSAPMTANRVGWNYAQPNPRW
jgi:aryl-phospho-beta-D-glucosidase BglC (GH1 family)